MVPGFQGSKGSRVRRVHELQIAIETLSSHSVHVELQGPSLAMATAYLMAMLLKRLPHLKRF